MLHLHRYFRDDFRYVRAEFPGAFLAGGRPVDPVRQRGARVDEESPDWNLDLWRLADLRAVWGKRRPPCICSEWWTEPSVIHIYVAAAPKAWPSRPIGLGLGSGRPLSVSPSGQKLGRRGNHKPRCSFRSRGEVLRRVWHYPMDLKESGWGCATVIRVFADYLQAFFQADAEPTEHVARSSSGPESDTLRHEMMRLSACFANWCSASVSRKRRESATG